jgi:hypothetical protein
MDIKPWFLTLVMLNFIFNFNINFIDLSSIIIQFIIACFNAMVSITIISSSITISNILLTNQNEKKFFQLITMFVFVKLFYYVKP